MTTFTYTPTHSEDRCVAYICLLDDDPSEPVLVIKNADGSNTWIYSEGDIVTADWSAESEAIHKFYRGDSVTITF